MISGGLGHAGHNDALEAAFGLGAAGKVDSLTVRWPGPAGKTTVLRDVSVDRFLLIREGQGKAEVSGPF